MAYFPMFLDIEGKHCLVVGGGKVALRKVQVLLDFGAHVTVVAQQIEKEIKDIAEQTQTQRKEDEISSMGFPRSEERSESYGQVTIYERAYTEEDLQDKVFVVAATDNAAVNHEIAEDARKRNIPVNAVAQGLHLYFSILYKKEKRGRCFLERGQQSGADAVSEKADAGDIDG